MVAKFAINASGAMLLPSLVQVTESISGSVVPLAMFISRRAPLSYDHRQDDNEESEDDADDDIGKRLMATW